MVLDRASLLQLGGGIVALMVVGFTAGAVTGFGLHARSLAEGPPAVPAEAPAPEAAPAPAVQASTTQSVPVCEPAEPAILRTADVWEGPGPADPVGPAAPGVRDRTVEQGLPGPDAAPPAREATPRYVVQVGVFGVERNAERMVVQLRARGYDPLVTAVRNRSGQWLQRVQLSAYGTEGDAVAAAESFTDREGLPAVVVTMAEGGA